MSEKISLDLIGATLAQMQTDQREDRLARELLQGQLGRLESRMVSREDLADMLRLFSRELGKRDARFDRIDEQLARIARHLGMGGGQ